MPKTLNVRLAGGPPEEATSASYLAPVVAPAAALDMHASEGAVSSEPAVSSGVGAAGDPVVSNALVVSHAPGAVHAAAVSGDGEVAADAEGAAPPMCSRRTRRRGKQPVQETCACMSVCMLIATV